MRDKIKQIADKACKKSMKKFEKGIEALNEGGVVPGNVKLDGVDVDFVTSRETIVSRAAFEEGDVQKQIISDALLIKFVEHSMNELAFQGVVKVLSVRKDARVRGKTVITYRYVEGKLADVDKAP